ncbi:hypothetical protein Tco_1570448 [Tanacetum coccineum]
MGVRTATTVSPLRRHRAVTLETLMGSSRSGYKSNGRQLEIQKPSLRFLMIASYSIQLLRHFFMQNWVRVVIGEGAKVNTVRTRSFVGEFTGAA